MEMNESQTATKGSTCCKPCMHMRHVIVALLTTSLFLSYTMIWSITYAIIAMAAPLPEVKGADNDTMYQCPRHIDIGPGAQATVGTLNWSQEIRTLIVNAGMWGYLCTQVPMGRLAELMNIKIINGVSIILSVILSALIPITAKWDATALIVLQAILGACAGANFPPSICLLSRWVTDAERSTMTALYFNGMSASFIAMPIFVTRLCETGFAGGWPSVFYVNAIMGIIWLLLWLLLAANRPEDSRWISREELDYILKHRLVTSNKSQPLPWKKLATSLPVWAVCAASFSISWPQILLMNELPSYMSAPLRFSVDEVGLLNTLVNIGSAVMLLLSGIIADLLRKCNAVSITTLRKIFIGFGGIATTICLGVMPSAGCDKVLVTIVSLVAMGGLTITLNASATASMEVAPNFAGTVSALWNFFGSIPSLGVSPVVAIETAKEVSLRTWGHVYYITASVCIIGILMFLFVGSAEPQPWAIKPDVSTELSDHPPSEGDNGDNKDVRQLWSPT